MARGRKPTHIGCSVPGCRRKHQGRGFCAKHLADLRKGEVTAELCSTPGCQRPRFYIKSGLCSRCYDNARDNDSSRPRCLASGCPRAATTRGYCQSHYSRLWREKSVDGPFRERGHGYFDCNGYIRLYVGNGVTKLQHRHVMEQIIGRELLPEETVHHINGDKKDNRPENLELWSSSHPGGQRVSDKVAWAIRIIGLYGEAYGVSLLERVGQLSLQMQTNDSSKRAG